MNEIRSEKESTCLSKSISHYFAGIAHLNSNKVGLIINNTDLTYSDLLKKSNQLAAFLFNEFNIKNGDVVGILSDPSEWSILSMLAILKLGAVYLPLDTRYPQSRLKYMIDDACISILITQRHLTGLITPDSSFPILYPDEAADKIGLFPDDFEKQDTSASDPAYIMYTSGTTGKPNGVVIPLRCYPMSGIS